MKTRWLQTGSESVGSIIANGRGMLAALLHPILCKAASPDKCCEGKKAAAWKHLPIDWIAAAWALVLRAHYRL